MLSRARVNYPRWAPLCVGSAARDVSVRSRDSAETTRLEVFKRFDEFCLGIHHERAVVRDGLTDRLTAEDVDIESIDARVLRLVRRNRNRGTCAKEGQLS